MVETDTTEVPEVAGYRFLEKLGEGGMSEVYRAVQLRTGRPVAIKLLRRFPRSLTPGLAFRREAEVMAVLDHPNVVAIYECGQVGGWFYLVMEFVDGPPLASLLRPGQPWPLDRAASLLDTIAAALAYIHDQGVLHLDLKPQNVLCGRHGEVKLTDFGLAQAPTSDPGRLPSSREIGYGSSDYCAPEQRYGLPVDTRTDLFALASVAYELLTGHLPGRVFVPATEYNPRLPAALDGVLRHALARDPDERTLSVEVFHQQLARAASS